MLLNMEQIKIENNGHPQKRRRYQKDSSSTDDIVTTLIHLVRQNPVLYNYKLQPNQRRRSDILNGWAQIAAAIGNRYSVEECRRKWKNLRDTYHQYRLRKSKIGDGLSKWRYAKDMEFLSNVYQPKLKSNRTQNFNTTTTQDNLLHSVSESNDEHDQVVHQDMVHSSIISVNDADTFILTSYEDVTHDNDVTHEDHNMSHNELNHDNNSIENCVEIVKHEQHTNLDDDGNTAAEVDYEEVCLYEESGNTPSVDCETIIGAPVTNSANSDDTKFQYIDTNDFCIGSMNPTRSQYSSSASSVIGASGTIKLKSLPMVSSSSASMVPTSSNNTLDTSPTCVTIPAMQHMEQLPELTPVVTSSTKTATANTPATVMVKTDPNPTLLAASTNSSNTHNGNNNNQNHQSSHQQQHHSHPPTYSNNATHVHNSSTNNNGTNMGTISIATTTMSAGPTCMVAADYCNHQREECDLFFDFLKKKIQRFPPEEITSIQVEFLNCVLRREAEHAQKIAHQQQHHHQQQQQQQHNMK
ncbi:probable serine/threonine-protein kinase ndrD [Musca domestica]|uniref:Probable serine/threonine-protein kinase ndrD n=1 Tax=Musca domestica TaxID=7370 RepID=A0A9J7IE90_MUSDO|nr:probable serine/threonine-protein kinase ndrD [Musca domestica]XP_019893163.2 probable serine/threonine-protein kinase ndrD [Musca domestica]